MWLISHLRVLLARYPHTVAQPDDVPAKIVTFMRPHDLLQTYHCRIQHPLSLLHSDPMRGNAKESNLHCLCPPAVRCDWNFPRCHLFRFHEWKFLIEHRTFILTAKSAFKFSRYDENSLCKWTSTSCTLASSFFNVIGRITTRQFLNTAFSITRNDWQERIISQTSKTRWVMILPNLHMQRAELLHVLWQRARIPLAYSHPFHQTLHRFSPASLLCSPPTSSVASISVVEQHIHSLLPHFLYNDGHNTHNVGGYGLYRRNYPRGRTHVVSHASLRIQDHSYSTVTVSTQTFIE